MTATIGKAFRHERATMTKPIQLILSISSLLIIIAATAFADLNLPQPQGMVSDFAGKLSPGNKQQIEALLQNFRDRTGIEVAVVTVPFDDMQGYTIEEYTLQLGRQWGVGHDSEKRALVLVVAIKPPDAQGFYHGGTRLEVSRHLEGDVPDILAGELIRKMRNDFTAGRFDQALTTGTQTILATLAQRLGISMDGIDSTQAARPPVRRPAATPRRGGISLFAIIIIAIVFFAIIRAIGGGRGGGGRRGGIGSDWLLWAILFGAGRGGGWGGWGGSSGGGSSWGGGGDSGGGGFGGFGGGGGDFGGGGASDSW